MKAQLDRRTGHDHAPYNKEDEDEALYVGWMALAFHARDRGLGSGSFPEDDLDE